MTRTRQARSGTSQETLSWLVLMLFAVVVLIPTACVLWFMTRAMQNERLAVRQKLEEAYRGHLSLIQTRLAEFWGMRGIEWDRQAGSSSGAELFARSVREGGAESAICFDADGNVIYPNAPAVSANEAAVIDETWLRAVNLEYIQADYPQAAVAYAAIAKSGANRTLAARAWQAQARSLVRAGRKDQALAELLETLNEDRFSQASDAEGRLIAPNAELMVLELAGDTNHSAYRATLARLPKRLSTYDASPLPASQRRFLMKEVQRLAPGVATFETLPAEELAASFLEAHEPRVPKLKSTLLPSLQLTNVWQIASPDGRVLALFRTDRLLSAMNAVIDGPPQLAGARVEILPPANAPLPDRFLVSLPAGNELPGWQLALALDDRRLFETAADERVASYVWTGSLVVAAMSILALLMGRIFRGQMELARLKNDLVATVTHELKTPLSSIRLLVDTLLDSSRLEERTTRDYLQLIAKENSRLSRLIDNFLAFSRMERNKHAFEFRQTTANEVVELAVGAVQERFEAPGCRLDVEVAPDLSPIVADVDALGTALINLLDNGFKYTGEVKHVRVRAFEAGRQVLFEVEDNGIGISPRETKKIFRRFYQVDQTLSRNAGGCGLGLSIVQFIAAAHRGTVRVESRPGQGSTFTIAIPGAQRNGT